ncbi:hypothetical protein [Lentibacillus sp. Marseille-P4043]|uniref:hypothetical protein n=1 Tax=Lentibacillus sp. Marseille-P4043 TaxID=2040293 RepID=UPI000D0AEFE9|nr:hypothetical protein [Lentibacillus sp. Marseille-P4043]
MSDKKKVIHVKDLVIKADNVYVEPRHHRRYDPFFGPGRQMEEQEDVESRSYDDDHHDNDDESGDNRRPPFSWI